MQKFYDATHAKYQTNCEETVLAQDIIEAAWTSAEVLMRKFGKRFTTLSVEDLFDETVCRAISGIARFDSRKASLKTWVSRIAWYYLLDWDAHETKCPELIDSFIQEDEEGNEIVAPMIEGYRGDEFEADRELRTAESIAEINGALDKLNESRKQAVHLAGQGFNPKEIALMTGWNANKVYILLSRGVKDFVERFGRETLKSYGIAA